MSRPGYPAREAALRTVCPCSAAMRSRFTKLWRGEYLIEVSGADKARGQRKDAEGDTEPYGSATYVMQLFVTQPKGLPPLLLSSFAHT